MNGYHTEFRPGTNWEPPRFQSGPSLTTPASAALLNKQQQPLFENNTHSAPLFGSNFDPSRWNPGNVLDSTPDTQTFAVNRTFLPPPSVERRWNLPTADQPQNNMLLGHTSQNPMGVSDFNIHDTQIPVDQSLIWRNPNPKRVAPPDKGTSLWGDPDHHATIEIKRWKTHGDDVVDVHSQAAVAAAAGSTFFNSSQQQQQQQQSSNLTNINNTNDNHVRNDDHDNNDIINIDDQNFTAKDRKDKNGCVTVSTSDNRLSTINDENNLTIDTTTIEKNLISETCDTQIDSSCKSETSSVRDETSSVLDDVKLRWGPVVSNSNDGSPWSSAPQTEDNRGNSTNPGGSSLDNTSSDSVFSSINANNNNNEISSSLINSIKDPNAHLNFAPAQKLLAGNLAPKDVEEKAEEYKMRLLSLVNRGYVELNSLGRLYEQENTVILLNNMMQICQQLDDLCQRQQQLQQMPQQKVLYDRLTNCEIPRLQTALQTLKEQIYAVCNNSTGGDNNASPRKNGALWSTDTPEQQNISRSFFSGHQPVRSSADSNSWSAINTTSGDHQLMNQQQNLISSNSNWSSSSMKHSKSFLDFTPNANMGENFDSAFGGLSLSDQNSRFLNGYPTEFRPGTKWEPPRQQAAVSRPPIQSMFKNAASAGFGAFDTSRKIIGSGFDSSNNAASFLTPATGAGRPPSSSWSSASLTTAPPPPSVFRAPPPHQQQQTQPQSLAAANQASIQQLPWFVLSKVNKNVNEAHLKMFLNNFGRIQAFYYWQPPGFALFQFADMPSPETAQLLQQRLYSQGITLTLHKQAEAEKIAEAMSSAPHGRQAAPPSGFGPGGAGSTSFAPSTGAQSSFFDNTMLYNKFP